MKILKHISKMNEEGFKNTKVIHIDSNSTKEWQIFPHPVKVLCLEESLLIELEDGTEYKIETGETYKITSNTFYRINNINDKSRFLMAS